MKKEYDFGLLDNNYIISEKENTVFSIDISSLEFKGKDFYEAIYKDVTAKDNSLNILLNNKLSQDDIKRNKTALFTYHTINDIIIEINSKFNKEFNIIKEVTHKVALNNDDLPF